MSDSNFRSFAASFAGELAALSLMNFAMKYQSGYESFYDSSIRFRSEKHDGTSFGRDLYRKITAAAKGIYDKEFDVDKTAGELRLLRDGLIEQMEKLTAYADYFRIHEYILNRIELRFSQEVKEIDNDEEARSLLSYIFEPEDNMEVNLRIKEMISSLPVRMTSNRFYDLVTESFTVYKDSERESLNSHVYMLRSAAGLAVDGNDTLFPEIKEYVEKFEKLEYKDITEAVYNEYADLLAEAGGYLAEYTEFVMTSMEMLNELTAFYTVRPYLDELPSVSESVKESIMMVSGLFEDEENDRGNIKMPDIDTAEKCFVAIEGRPEKLSAKIEVSNGRLESFKNSIDGEDTMLMDSLLDAGKLMSSSEFVKLDYAYDITPVSREILDEVCAGFINELKTAFEGMDKLRKRAVMSQVLKELPVFFTSHTEVMNYIRYTLENCRDNAEKAASLALFKQSCE